MKVPGKAQTLLSQISDVLDLLDRKMPPGIGTGSGSAMSEALPSLLDTCERLVRAADAPPTLRLVQHFACTGGTIISRALAAMPNVQLLSEIDPLSTIMVNRAQPSFAPSDLIFAMRHAVREVDEALLCDMFLASLEVLHAGLAARGQLLVLRDHTHSRYCTARDPASRPGLSEIVAPRFHVLPVVTIRHPLDSFLSLIKNGWHRHLPVATLDGYAQRYAMFLDETDGQPRFRYEDFTEEPAHFLSELCSALGLDFSPDAIALIPAITLSGDSGRRANRIGRRARREIPAWVAEDMARSEAYRQLCDRMGYDPTD
ncbi:MAG: hypothetical protein Kow0013_28150 [Pararhodobacter sp.]